MHDCRGPRICATRDGANTRRAATVLVGCARTHADCSVTLPFTAPEHRRCGGPGAGAGLCSAGLRATARARLDAADCPRTTGADRMSESGFQPAQAAEPAAP